MRYRSILDIMRRYKMTNSEILALCRKLRIPVLISPEDKQIRESFYGTLSQKAKEVYEKRGTYKDAKAPFRKRLILRYAKMNNTTPYEAEQVLFGSKRKKGGKLS